MVQAKEHPDFTFLLHPEVIPSDYSDFQDINVESVVLPDWTMFISHFGYRNPTVHVLPPNTKIVVQPEVM